MRLLAPLLAFAVLAACPVAAVPTTRLVIETQDASVIAMITVDGPSVHAREPAPVADDDRDDDSQSENEDPTDDTDLELLGVLPNVLAFEVARGSASHWSSTHARPQEDPDSSDPKRPPIST